MRRKMRTERLADDRQEESTVFSDGETGDGAEASGDAADGIGTGISESADGSGRKKKPKKSKKGDGKKEMQTLDTSALLQKRDQRKQI